MTNELLIASAESQWQGAGHQGIGPPVGRMPRTRKAFGHDVEGSWPASFIGFSLISSPGFMG